VGAIAERITRTAGCIVTATIRVQMIIITTKTNSKIITDDFLVKIFHLYSKHKFNL
jgi:hypothetical protein